MQFNIPLIIHCAFSLSVTNPDKHTGLPPTTNPQQQMAELVSDYWGKIPTKLAWRSPAEVDLSLCESFLWEFMHGGFKGAKTASDPPQHFDLQQLADFTSSILQSFKARSREFHEHTCLIISSLIHTSVQWTKSIWVTSLLSLSKILRLKLLTRRPKTCGWISSNHCTTTSRTGKQTEMDRTEKTRVPADYQNLECASCHIPHT